MIKIRLLKELPVWEEVPWYKKPFVWARIYIPGRVWFIGRTPETSNTITVHPDNLETLVMFLKLERLLYEMEKPELRSVDDTSKK
jgi:hypothetical protein